MMPSLFSDPVVAIVLVSQVAILLRCWTLARGDDSEVLDRLWKDFKQDINNRAKRGDGPDWVRYMDEADRVHERRVDRMRVWATAALVVGIGGTMAALAVRLWGLSTFELEVLTAFAPALVASLTGVVNNLVITLGLFRVSDHRFEEALNSFRQALQTCSDANAPQEKFADAVRDQLGQAFREAVRSFPEAFAHLDKSVQHMGEVATAQSQSMLTAASGLQKGVDGLTAAAAQIAPVAGLLNTATTELRTGGAVARDGRAGAEGRDGDRRHGGGPARRVYPGGRTDFRHAGQRIQHRGPAACRGPHERDP